MRFHDLHHLAACGWWVKIGSEMLGHSQISITLDLYGHATPTMHEQATEAMNRIFSR